MEKFKIEKFLNQTVGVSVKGQSFSLDEISEIHSKFYDKKKCNPPLDQVVIGGSEETGYYCKIVRNDKVWDTLEQKDITKLLDGRKKNKDEKMKDQLGIKKIKNYSSIEKNSVTISGRISGVVEGSNLFKFQTLEVKTLSDQSENIFTVVSKTSKKISLNDYVKVEGYLYHSVFPVKAPKNVEKAWGHIIFISARKVELCKSKEKDLNTVELAGTVVKSVRDNEQSSLAPEPDTVILNTGERDYNPIAVTVSASREKLSLDFKNLKVGSEIELKGKIYRVNEYGYNENDIATQTPRFDESQDWKNRFNVMATDIKEIYREKYFSKSKNREHMQIKTLNR